MELSKIPKSEEIYLSGKDPLANAPMRIGIDLGGTKVEALAIDSDGVELARHRIHTPRDNYVATIEAMAGLVRRIEHETGHIGTVGAGIPGSISSKTGLVKNSNSTWLNGQPLHRDLGTGCGGGVAINGQVHAGPNGVAGEWGHNPLPWQRPEEYPGPVCYCGKRGCMEMWVSGTGLARDYKESTGKGRTAREILADFEAGDAEAVAVVGRLEDRLARGLAQVINILDPDAIVVGGGLSKAKHLYESIPKRLAAYVFGGEADTPILPAKYGDSSGVRGAAWLWPAIEVHKST